MVDEKYSNMVGQKSKGNILEPVIEIKPSQHTESLKTWKNPFRMALRFHFVVFVTDFNAPWINHEQIAITNVDQIIQASFISFYYHIWKNFPVHVGPIHWQLDLFR